jgi:NhaP-type Na+/H+ and K+/H+ antiporter
MLEWIYLVTLVGTLLVLIAAFSSLLAFRFGAPLLLLFLGITWEARLHDLRRATAYVRGLR